MRIWSPHTYLLHQPSSKNPGKARLALQYARTLQRQGLPAILSIKHLAILTRVPYSYLRMIVSRRVVAYRTFFIPKRSGGVREISAPQETLRRLHRWIVKHILRKRNPHQAAYAYRYGMKSPLLDCAAQHCECKWLLKIDIQDFFHNISERQVYQVFSNLGYWSMIAFGLSKICTTIDRLETSENLDNVEYVAESEYTCSYRGVPLNEATREELGKLKGHTGGSRIPYRFKWVGLSTGPYRFSRQHWWYDWWHKCKDLSPVGHLPQGAPTSPMLSNLALVSFDERVEAIAMKAGFVYTRYSDDLIFSAALAEITHEDTVRLLKNIYATLKEHGFYPAIDKTVLAGPGTRRTVLGLSVDTEHPRLSRNFRRYVERHVHFIRKHGWDGHYSRESSKFASVDALRLHLKGKLSYARQIDPDWAAEHGHVFELDELWKKR